jgi:hypothetical protein
MIISCSVETLVYGIVPSDSFLNYDIQWDQTDDREHGFNLSHFQKVHRYLLSPLRLED